jgi:hypothetical protein
MFSTFLVKVLAIVNVECEIQYGRSIGLQRSSLVALICLFDLCDDVISLILKLRRTRSMLATGADNHCVGFRSSFYDRPRE